MAKAKKPESNKLVPTVETMKCQLCGKPMKKISWCITAAAFDAREEVEQTVFKCMDDGRFFTIEVSTGNPSEFAIDPGYPPEDLLSHAEL
jgi:hypothetical protein